MRRALRSEAQTGYSEWNSVLIELIGVSDRISQARIRAGMTQRGVAKALGLTIGSIQAYEYQRANLTLARAAELAELYGVSIDWIAFGTQATRPDPRLDIIKRLFD